VLVFFLLLINSRPFLFDFYFIFIERERERERGARSGEFSFDGRFG
jgi:hypothetical protein